MRKLPTKAVYYVNVLGSDGNKIIWEVVYNHVAEYPKENDKIGLRFFTKMRGGGG